MTIEEMRALLDLGPDVEPIDVVTAYVASLDGEPAPAALITLDEAKAHLKIRHSDEDDLIQGYLDAAIAALDGPEGWLQRTLIQRTVTSRLDTLPAEPFRLPLPPVQSVIAIEVMASVGEWTVVDSTAWTFEDERLDLVPGYAWPWPCVPTRGVRVIYQAGYEVLPKPIRAAILLMMADLYQNRETSVPTANAIKVPMSTTVENLLAGFGRGY